MQIGVIGAGAVGSASLLSSILRGIAREMGAGARSAANPHAGVRCGGSWKRDYGPSYPGTKGETPDTDKERPTGYRASSRPYRRSVRVS